MIARAFLEVIMEPNANGQAETSGEDVVLDDDALSIVSGGKGVIRNGLSLD